jgi:hypothetical protein
VNVSYLKTLDKLQKLLIELDNDSNLVNSFFRLSKGTPEQLKKYDFTKRKFIRTYIITYLFYSFFLNILRIISYFVFSGIFKYQHTVYNSKISPSEVIFLTHGTKENMRKINSDDFFASAPNYLELKGFRVSVVYMNHGFLHYTKKAKLLNAKSGNINRILFPKFLTLNENWKYINYVLPLAVKSLLLGFSRIFSNPLESVLLLKSFVYFFHRSTYNNYLLGTRMSELCNFSTTRGVIMTFEGHVYEQYIIKKINELHFEPLILLYQHSPIVRNHFGIINFLNSKYNRVKILTTGSFYKHYFEQLSLVPDYFVFGSAKYATDFTRYNGTETIQALFAPEADNSAALSFMNLLYALSFDFPSMIFTLRLHPNFKKNIRIKLLLMLFNLKSNIKVSKDSLTEDLRKSKYVFYRTSSVGIEALRFNTMPVFYGSKEQQGLNVLTNTSTMFQAVSNRKEAKHFFHNEQSIASLIERNILYNSMLSRLNYEILDEIFQN